MNNRQYLEGESHVHMLGFLTSRAEIDNALKSLNNDKTTGTANTPAEILKNLEEAAKEHLVKFINKCYEEGTVPSDFIGSRTIINPMKDNFLDRANYRTISILSHASKIILNIVKNRI